MNDIDNSSARLVKAGYICGGLSLLFFPPAFGIAGLVCGIINLTRGNIGHGIAQIVIAVTCSLIGIQIGIASMSR